jgi:pyrimidine deaminase RibD-like protein
MKYVNRALKEAKKSQQRFKHAALLVKGGAVIAFAFNTENTHAEVRAIKRAAKTKGCVLISIRAAADGRTANAYPCNNCCKAIKEAGITEVQYSVTGWDMLISKNVE